MKERIERLINDLNNVEKYNTDSNSDCSSGYDHIVTELLESQKPNSLDMFQEVLNNLEIDYIVGQESFYFDKLLDELSSNSVDYYCNIEIKNLGYSLDYNKGALLQISIGEIEHQFDDSDTKSHFWKGIQEKLGKDTDWFLKGNDLAYLDLTSYFVCYQLLKDELQELINKTNEDYELKKED